MAVVASVPIKSYRRTFTSAELAGGMLTVTHNLGQKAVGVFVYDENDGLMIMRPALSDTTSLTLDFTNSATWAESRTVLVLA